MPSFVITLNFKGLVFTFLSKYLFIPQAQRDAKARIPPSEMFKHETDKYSKFDEQVSV